MEEYKWLCSTMQFDKDICSDPDTGSMVTKDEGYLVDKLTTEAYGIYGLKLVYYVVSEDVKRDKLFGEDTLQFIDRAFNFMGYTDKLPSNVRTYQLQGIWGEDLLIVTTSIVAFKYWSTYGGEDRNTPEVEELIQPRIGDIVYFQVNDLFYEVVDVKYFTEAFGVKKHTYTISLKIFKDRKLTINKEHDTLKDSSDSIYKYNSEEIENQYELEDTLKINQKLKKEKNLLYLNNKQTSDIDPFGGW